jgi:PKD repeat protein
MYNAAAPSSNASRILAYGMRNPFRFTMRPNTNEIWVADVGWGIYEEINRITTPTPTKAQNFGWPCIEKQTRLSGYRDLDMCKALYNDTVSPASDPYFAYEHGLAVPGNDTCGTGSNGSSITGAVFYSGTRYPASYNNALFFADNARNCIWVMTAGANGLPDTSTVKTFVDDSDNPYPVDLVADPVSKDIFYVNIASGTVNRISYASSNRAPTAVASATPTSGAAPLAVTLNGSASTDPDGDTLTYSWDVDGNGSFGDATGKTPVVTYSNGGTYQARLLVTDPGGLSATSSQVTITVTSASGPVNTVAPAITGTPQTGGTLTSTTGTWTGTAPITYGRQWQRCTTGTGTSYSQAVLAQAPSVYWRLGEASGTAAADASGNARPGTYVGGVGLAKPGALTGDANTSALFDGADDDVLRNPITGVGGTSISADLWLKTANTTKEAGIVSYAVAASADEFQLRDPRALRVYVKGARVDTGVALNDGAWHHLAVTWTSAGGAVRVYKDGVLAFSNSVPVQAGATMTAGGALVLGQEQDAVGGGFDATQAFLGNLDEVALYPSALTAAQVQAHKAAAAGTGGGTSCADIANATAATYSPQIADQGATIRIRVSATNAGGTSSAVSAAVGPVTTGAGNTPPVPVINTPLSSLTWKAGDTVSFSGAATDTQDGNEPASRLSWSIILGHCTTQGCHTHPLATRPGVASGTIAAPDHEAPSYMEITLTATDASGATASTVRRIDPKTVQLTFQTNPAGLSLAVGASQSAPAPFTQQWVVNSQVQLNAPSAQTVAGVNYTFTGWSDGGAATHTINAPAANTTYTASYTGGACTGTSYESAVKAQTPTVYWRLGEASGTAAADASGNARPGTYVGGVGLAKPGALTGDANTSAQFDGADDNVIRNPITGVGTTAISTDLWLKTNDTTKEAGIVSYAVTGSADEFQLRDPRALRVYVRGARVDTGVVLNDGAWHHLAVTWTSVGGAVRVYKDGALAFSNTVPVQAGTAITAGGALVLGQEQDAVGGGFEASQAFLGNLDEVALYPSALTATQVQAHRQAGLLSGCPAGAALMSARSTSSSGTPRLVEGSELLPSLVGPARLLSGSPDSVEIAVGVDHPVGFCPLDQV